MTRKRGKMPQQKPAKPTSAPAAIPESKANGSRRLGLYATLIALLACAAALLAWQFTRPDTAKSQATAAVAPATPKSTASYVSDNACTACHTNTAEQWRGSHHDLAMAHASRQTVRGNFVGSEFSHRGERWRFREKDGHFYVDVPDGKSGHQTHEIKYTFGVDPLQQYLVEFPGGRLQPLPIAWDTRRQHWFHLHPESRAGADDPLHWTGRYQNWNLMCAECHSTNLRKAYDAEADTYATRWDEINVGCQACHGPGSAHVGWAEAQRDGKPVPAGAEKGLGLVVDFRAGDSRYEVDSCGACHARRQRLTDGDQPGAPFLDNFRPELLRTGLYHPDGQQLDEVYVYGSMLQSRMYQHGVRCTDCHQAHSLKLKAEGNGVCVQCHNPAGNPRFPTLRKQAYDTPAHHHHPAGSPGAECRNCHMPEKKYMVVHARPDHSFRIPRPDLSQQLGTPNACNQCHGNKTAAWAAEAVSRWYGAARRQEPGFGASFAAARAGRRDAQPQLIAILGDTSQPAIVRATAAELLAANTPETQKALTEALKDREALVRAYAVIALSDLPPAERPPLLAPLLRDPIRLVRINAAQALAALPPGTLATADETAFENAYREFQTAQAAMADMPATQLNQANLHAQQGNDPAARAAYARTLHMDPDFGAARIAFAGHLSAQGDRTGAEAALREGLRRHPADTELHYNLGLLLAEAGQLQEAANELRQAVKLRPDNARYNYNLGLALMQLGRLAEAEAPLAKAERLDRDEPAYPYALAVLLLQLDRPQSAQPHAERYLTLNPGDAQATQLVEATRRNRP